MSLSEDKKSVLAALERLVKVPAGEWRYVSGKLRPLRLARGQSLTRAGEVADRFGFVVRGLMKKAHVTERGRAHVRGFGGPGAWVGAYASLLTGEPSYLSVEAVVDCELLVLDWSLMNELYQRHPAWQELGRRVAEGFVLEREARAHELLTRSARERYEAFRVSHRELLPLLKSYDIASYLGITPVSLSRLKRRSANR